MKLSFSILQDISANAVLILENPVFVSKNAQNKAQISVAFSLQRIPISNNFEFIPAHSVIKTHGHRPDFKNILSAIERSALHSLFSAYRFGLHFGGIRVKLTELQTVDSMDLESQLFQCSYDAIDDAIHSCAYLLVEFAENHWRIPLTKRFDEITNKMRTLIEEDEASDFEKWTTQSDFAKGLKLFEQRNPEFARNQFWISDEEFIRFVRDVKLQQFEV